jgi:hypothetical protein
VSKSGEYQINIYRNKYVGVPQGTLCGPLFWLAFINSYQPPKCQQTMYADDITCYWRSGGPVDSGAIQDCVQYGMRWCDENCMQLNLNKTKIMCLWRPRADINDAMTTVHITQETEIEVVTSAKFLGIVIDNRLNFNDHISQILSKTGKRFYFLLHLKRLGISTDKLVSFYLCSTVNSCLCYSCFLCIFN